MADFIPKVVKGQAPTLLDAELANQLIVLHNVLKSSNQGIIVTDKNARIDLEYLQSQLENLIDKLGATGVTGFTEETITICVNGTPTDKVFLTKDPPA